MTTDPTPDLCCVHGPKLDRILELLEERRTPKLAEGGLVKGPEGHEPPIANRGCDYVISQEDAHRMWFNPTWNDPR